MKQEKLKQHSVLKVTMHITEKLKNGYIKGQFRISCWLEGKEMKLQQPAVQWAQEKCCDLSLARSAEVNGTGFCLGLFLFLFAQGLLFTGKSQIS